MHEVQQAMGNGWDGRMESGFVDPMILLMAEIRREFSTWDGAKTL